MPDRMYTLPDFAPVFETHPRTIAEVDWDANDDFSGLYDSLEADTDGLEYVVGKDRASQLVSTAIAGRASIHVINDEGRYSLHNGASPLAGKLLPRRKARIMSLTPTTGVLFTGWTTGAPKVAASIGNWPSATLSLIGPLGLLANPNLKINPAPLHNVRTGVVINAILDAAGWPAANRVIDIGDMLVGDWFPQDIGALEALQQIADLEGGTIREGKNWDIVFEGRFYRDTDARSLTSQATFTDASVSDLGYNEISLDEEQVYNRAEVTVTQFRQDADSSEIWRLEPIALQPGESRIIIAQYPADVAFADTGLSHNRSVIPSSLTGSVTITPVIRARRVEYTITNTHGSLTAGVEIWLTARAWRQTQQFLVRREDLVSQGKYELSTYPFPSPWFYNEAYAAAQAEWAIAKYSEPIPLVRIGFPPADQPTLDQVLALEVSDRVTVIATSLQTQFGISGDFYVEQTSLKLGARQMPAFTMDLSQAVADPGWGVFDVDRFNIDMRFGR